MSSLEDLMLIDYVADHLPQFFPGLELIGHHNRVGDKGAFDLCAKDSAGISHYFEIKGTRCNRLTIGQIVERKAKLAEVDSKARVILVCKDVDASLRELLAKIGVSVYTFSSLGIPDNLPNNQVKTGMMRLSPVEQRAYFALLREGSTLVKAADLSSLLGISPAWSKNILSRLARKGVAHRIGRGKYAVIPADVLSGRKSYVADAFILIGELMREADYYVAYCSAAQIHGITEQIPLKTTVAVLKQLRPLNVGDLSVSFINLKQSRFFGYQDTQYMGIPLKVSDLEKTIIDCVDRQELCSGITEVIRILMNALETQRLDWQKLVSYTNRFQSHAVAQRLGFILDYLGRQRKTHIEPEVLEQLKQLRGSKTYPLDAKAPKRGKVSREWRIISNAGRVEL